MSQVQGDRMLVFRQREKASGLVGRPRSRHTIVNPVSGGGVRSGDTFVPSNTNTLAFAAFVFTALFLTISSFLVGLYIEDRENKLEDFMYIHLPRSGGTRLESWAKAHNVSWGYEYFKQSTLRPEIVENDECKSTSPCNAWHIPPKCFKHNPYQGFKTICAIRDPIDRVKSAYLYTFGVLNRGQGYDFDCTADSMNRFVKEFVMPGKDYGCFFMPATDFMFDLEQKPVCDYVWDVKNLSNEFQNLFPGISIETKQINHIDPCKGILSRANFSDESIGLLKQKYKRDFEYISSMKEA